MQGVFFRDTVRRLAREGGVAGWVRNNDDGTVEAVFEGDPEAVNSMVRFVGEGPERAVVEGIQQHEEEPEGLDGFRVV